MPAAVITSEGVKLIYDYVVRTLSEEFLMFNSAPRSSWPQATLALREEDLGVDPVACAGVPALHRHRRAKCRHACRENQHIARGVVRCYSEAP